MAHTSSDRGPARTEQSGQDDRKVYLVGGGIASLAAAVFLIRDGNVLGTNITVLEELDRLGGSLDGSGSPEAGYVIRGGRMLESKYLCTFDLFSSIPTLDGSRTVTDEIFAFSESLKTASQSRLFREGHRVAAPRLGLGEKQIVGLELLRLEPESMLGRQAIEDRFDASFFETDFWYMWCTTFAFQPWHSLIEFRRYLRRFAHMVVGFNQLHGIMRTVYNQYDSMIRPIQNWLAEHGVRFALNTRVTDLACREDEDGNRVGRIVCECEGQTVDIEVRPRDLVIITLGSMTEASGLGSMDSPPPLKDTAAGGAWTLWEKIAAGRPEFGRPSVFDDHIDESKWVSFTTTQHDPTFFRLVRDATGNVPGEGGLVTFTESSWLMSIVVPHQPHFLGQPEDVFVFWGYGLSMDRPGDVVKKPMSDCSGREIMTELLGQLRIRDESPKILQSSTCIPCMMPFITSQFLRREHGDRPKVVPDGWANLGFIGQFCEMPDDVVFTVDYSVRSAMVAVYDLLGLKKRPPSVYKGQYDPRVLYKAFLALHDV